MDKLNLEFINLDRLVKELNLRMPKSEGVIELVNFVHREPRKNPFLYRLDDRELEARGKYTVIQTVDSKGVRALFDLESEVKIGYVFVETGYTDASSDYGGRYETVRLRIKHPLELRGEVVIPNCSVKLLKEVDEVGEPYQERKDHVRVAGLVWIKKDLSKILPTEWFLYERDIEPLLKTPSKT